MSRSFLVESLLITDDVKRDCSADSSSIGTSVADITVSHLATPYNHLRLTESFRRNKPLTAAAIQCRVLETPSPHHQLLQYHRPAPCDSRSRALLNYSVHYQQPQVVANIQLQRLAAAMRTSPMSSEATTSARWSVDTHQRRRHSHDVYESLRLAVFGVVPVNYLHRSHHDHTEQRNRADLHHSCTSTSSPPNDNNETGQQTASFCQEFPNISVAQCCCEIN